VLNALADRSVVVFSTNYDRVVEVVCEACGITASDGFGSNWTHPVVNWNGRFEQHGLKLAKLHGSVTWYAEHGTAEFVRLDRAYALADPDLTLARGGRQLRPLMIIPTLEKETLTQPYGFLAQHLASTLASIRLLIVLGSSLRDQHLVNAIDYQRDRLAVLVLGRGARATADRLQTVYRAAVEVDTDRLLRHGVPALVDLLDRVADLEEPQDLAAAIGSTRPSKNRVSLGSRTWAPRSWAPSESLRARSRLTYCVRSPGSAESGIPPFSKR
jgi:hypothetical protein